MRPYLSSLLLLVACSAPAYTPHEIADQAISQDDFHSALDRRPSATAAALIDSPEVMAFCREFYGPTACQSRSGVNPGFAAPTTRPVASRWFALRGATRLAAPAPPTTMAWWLVSFRPRPDPVDWSEFGMPGCQLLVHPDHVVAIPQRSSDLTSNARWITYLEGGMVYLLWRPDQSDIGLTMYMQLLVAAPGENDLGFLVSQGIEIMAGER